MKDADNRAFWQKMARHYGPMMEKSSGLYQDIADRIIPHLSESMTVLELACGTGQLSFRLARHAGLWEATDFSPAMIEEAKRAPRSARLRFSVQDATALPYADETFDAVVIANALHIMPHPEKALAEIRRILKPGGLLFAPTFIRSEHPAAKLRLKIMALGGFRIYYSWNRTEFRNMIHKAGFSVTASPVLGGSIVPLCALEARRVP